ncbi:MAG: hypothetical protein DMF47_04080 [Verrucomicrobia bacterium]|nr:MAG: hypothetical protein DMF47_04080 [Verrucomicrobiota bacterium]
MSNILRKEKQETIIGALAEGNSIRSIERMSGVHRDTIMRLGVRVGNGCAAIMDSRMRNLECRLIQMDEIWGFIGKKNRHATTGERLAGLGDVWTFVAIDVESRMVPAYLVGKRDTFHATEFVEDLASRLNNRPQISSDALAAYVTAIRYGFQRNADYGQLVKVYSMDEIEEQRRYSPARLVRTHKLIVAGNPDESLISTSCAERQNLTMRMHMRRLTRLTNAFSKKFVNFRAAVALHFGYYNFVRVHKSLRMTPAMAGGVTDHIWTVPELMESAK